MTLRESPQCWIVLSVVTSPLPGQAGLQFTLVLLPQPPRAGSDLMGFGGWGRLTPPPSIPWVSGSQGEGAAGRLLLGQGAPWKERGSRVLVRLCSCRDI